MPYILGMFFYWKWRTIIMFIQLLLLANEMSQLWLYSV